MRENTATIASEPMPTQPGIQPPVNQFTISCTVPPDPQYTRIAGHLTLTYVGVVAQPRQFEEQVDDYQEAEQPPKQPQAREGLASREFCITLATIKYAANGCHAEHRS